MFTSGMSNEEIEREAARDFVEINWFVRNEFDKFRKKVLRMPRSSRNFVQYTSKKFSVNTRRRNTWHVECYTMPGNDEDITMAGYLCYYILERGQTREYIVFRGKDGYSSFIDIFTDHFIERYKERYIIPNRINLKGQAPALHFALHADKLQLADYVPIGWTEEDLKEKNLTIWVSDICMVVASFSDKMRVFITFLSQENLSKYRSLVYEEEIFWNLLQLKGAPDAKNTSLDKSLNIAKLYHRPDSKEIMERMLRRKFRPDLENREGVIQELLEVWDKLGEICDESIRLHLKKMKQDGEEPVIFKPKYTIKK